MNSHGISLRLFLHILDYLQIPFFIVVHDLCSLVIYILLYMYNQCTFIVFGLIRIAGALSLELELNAQTWTGTRKMPTIKYKKAPASERQNPVWNTKEIKRKTVPSVQKVHSITQRCFPTVPELSVR